MALSTESSLAEFGNLAVGAGGGQKFVKIAQGSAASLTLAAAVTGIKHRVLAAVFSATQSGGTAPTVKFVGGSTDIMGPVEVGAASVPNFVLPYSPVGWCETGDNEALKITSTTEGFQGVVVYQEIA